MKNKVVLFAFAFYKTMRPLLGFGVCCHIPTCSKYAKECFSRHSFFRALFLSCKRLLRCHPFSPGGFDPVP